MRGSVQLLKSSEGKSGGLEEPGLRPGHLFSLPRWLGLASVRGTSEERSASDERQVDDVAATLAPLLGARASQRDSIGRTADAGAEAPRGRMGHRRCPPGEPQGRKRERTVLGRW